MVRNTVVHRFLEMIRGGMGDDSPPESFKKRKKLKYGVFSCIKISFSVIFNKEIHALRGLLSQF